MAMPASVSISFDDLESALFWVSSAEPCGNAAYISRASGRVFFVSGFGDSDEDLPGELDDDTLYLAVPHRNELELGRSLVFRYANEFLPDDERAVRDYFQRRGAYARFKDLLQRRGRLEHWHDYERQATELALREWARDNGLGVVARPGRSPDDPGPAMSTGPLGCAGVDFRSRP